MTEKIKKYPYIILLLIVGAVYFFLKYISPLVSPVLLAFFLTMIAAPMVENISKRTRMRKKFVVALLLMLFLAILGFIILIGCILGGQFIPKMVQQLPLFEGQVYLFVEDCCSFFEDKLGIDGNYMREYLTAQISVLIQDLRCNFVPGVISNSMNYFHILFAIGGFLVVFFISLFLLSKDYKRIWNKLEEGKEGRYFVKVAENIVHYCATFLRAQLIILLSISILCAVFLTVFGVDKGYLWGILAGIMDALPFIGTGIVLIPLGIWQLINGKILQAVICVLLYALCAVLRECMEPRLIGKRVGISPVLILLSVFAGLKLFGVWGIIKGPFGIVMITQIYEMIICKKEEIDETYD